MKLKATRDLVLVKLEDMSSKADIVMPDTVKQDEIMKATKGHVVSVGPRCEEVKVGDFVHYNAFVGNQIKDDEVNDGVYVIVAEKDILCRRGQ